MVEIRNLTKHYGRNTAVKGISFEIRDNEILGFLGPNGAGKSTTMNIIAGYLPASAGSVTVCGHDITEDAVEAKKCIGYLPEIPPVYPDMRVEEYLKFCAGLKGVKRADIMPQVEKAMERLVITDMRRRLIRNLSKGYKQRVGFAQALLGSPKVLILDEPTVGLDPAQVTEVRRLILDLKRDHSIIFSSHSLSEVSAVCERVVIINKGEILAEDTIEHLEASMTANTLLNLTVDGDRDTIVRIIKDVQGVKAVRDIRELAERRWSLSAELENEDARGEIMTALVSNKCGIVEMNMAKLSLEQVFLKVTSQAGGKRSSLQDLLDETPEAPDNPYDSE
ncbi:MAG: ATP-binding cassette domain-containing protein [Oscillospiraceae bacterium]|nr:ATP-binding cassette domain-containing protein [Oscillospiraceae bacterium]